MNKKDLEYREYPINDDNEQNLTIPYNEIEVFHSIWDALRWKHIRRRVPICFKKTIRSRYMLANLVYLGYTIGFLVADFSFPINASTDETSNISDSTAVMTTAILDQPAGDPPVVNKMYFSESQFLDHSILYWWAWDDRSWRDVIMIPEYLNMIEAGLYIWSTSWYPRLDTLGGYYTMFIHKIETTAGVIDVFATFGWIMSWYMTYTRTLGRGFSLDDPDVIAFSMTTLGAIVYVVYNVQVLIHPEDYDDNTLYTKADIIFFVGACFYIFANMRDLNWFWFLPLAGQYGVAPGRVSVPTKVLPQYGKAVVLMTDCCLKRPNKPIEQPKHIQLNIDDGVISTYF
ncbi:unnamed protein product [Adineta ricciae]|uniref:Uncharacterized protein n=1 Tax=Adineta ricciae TaxID=249248 RepID=A0A815WJT4_ADIRI|nr:unnamed protein product [Adineta ricciae]